MHPYHRLWLCPSCSDIQITLSMHVLHAEAGYTSRYGVFTRSWRIAVRSLGPLGRTGHWEEAWMNANTASLAPRAFVAICCIARRLWDVSYTSFDVQMDDLYILDEEQRRRSAGLCYCLEPLLGPFHGAIVVPSVTRCRCRRCRRWRRGHRCAGGVRQYSGDT